MKNFLPDEKLVLDAIRDIRRNDEMKKQMLYIYKHGNEKQKRIVLKALKEYTDLEEQFDEYKTEYDWKEFYTKPRFEIETENAVFNIFLDLKYGLCTDTTPKTIKNEIITDEELDEVAMEFVTKQKIKFLYVCGGEKEKIFVTKMVKRFIENHGFSEADLKKINDAFENFKTFRKETNHHSI